MMRAAFSIFCFLLLLPQPALQAQAVRPLGEILLNLGHASEARARKIAEKQAVQHWKMDKGPLYKSCPAMINTKGNVVSDEKIFEGDFTPNSNKTKLAIFSDDGCDVWVDGERILHNFKKPQHLPNLQHSFHVLDQYKPEAGKPNHIRVHYSNTIYLGKTDIDGCTLFAYSGGGHLITVGFVSQSFSVKRDAGFAKISVNLNSPSSRVVTVQYRTKDGTAVDNFNKVVTAGTIPFGNLPDYQTTEGKLTFQLGTLNQSFKVPVMNNGETAPEFLHLTLSHPTNATLSTGAAILVLLAQAQPPEFAGDDFEPNQHPPKDPWWMTHGSELRLPMLDNAGNFQVERTNAWFAKEKLIETHDKDGDKNLRPHVHIQNDYSDLNKVQEGNKFFVTVHPYFRKLAQLAAV